MEFSRQQYWSALSCPSPGDRPHPVIEPWSPALQADSLPFFWATREALPAVGWGHKEGAGGDCGSDRLCTAALWGPFAHCLGPKPAVGKRGWGMRRGSSAGTPWHLCSAHRIWLPTPFYTQWILLSHKKKKKKKAWSLAICRNTDGLRGHYAKWNKSERERWILFDITYMWNLKNTTK